MPRIRMLEETKTRSGVGQKGPWSFHYQAGLVTMGNEVRQVFIEVKKDDAKKPVYLAPGEYDYSPKLTVNQYGEFALSRDYDIAPVKAAAPARAAA